MEEEETGQECCWVGTSGKERGNIRVYSDLKQIENSLQSISMVETQVIRSLFR